MTFSDYAEAVKRPHIFVAAALVAACALALAAALAGCMMIASVNQAAASSLPMSVTETVR